jgi:hypothetical protein
VTAQGDARIQLRSGDSSLSPGPVASGSYEIWADFGHGFARQSLIALRPGDDVVIRCNRMKLQCKVER